MNALQIETIPAPKPLAEIGLAPVLPPGERARRLMADAKAASLEHLDALQAAIGTVVALSEQVVASGDLYDSGLNDFSRIIAEDLTWRAKTLEVLVERQRHPARNYRVKER